MKPIAIFQFSLRVEPGYFAIWLRDRGINFEMIRIDQGAAVPALPDAYAGICLLGGDMSVNDAWPWIPKVLDLIRVADTQGIPLIGHCLGGQLMARALGGVVTRNAVQEIGWGALQCADNASARDWVRDAAGRALEGFTTFQWHGDTFSLPPAAVPIFSSRYCANQGYVIERVDAQGLPFAHLGMQCHVEMTPALIRAWVAEGVDEIAVEVAQHGVGATQMPQQILRDLETRNQALSRVAAQLYRRWLQGVTRAL